MKRYILFVVLLFLVTGCSSVKTVGDGMTVGAAGAKSMAGPIGGVGVALSIGSDLVSLLTPAPTMNEKVAAAAAKWTKHHTTMETAQLSKLREGSTGAALSNLNTAIIKAKDDANTGHFSIGPKGEWSFIVMMHKYELGEWISVLYPAEGIPDKAIKMYCNKQADACIISTQNEHVDFPAFRESTLALKKNLNGATASFGDFDSYEPGLNQLRCVLFTVIRPPRTIIKKANGQSDISFTYADAVKSSLIREAYDASGFVENSPTRVTGKITKIDYSGTTPEWGFEVALTSTNGRTLTIYEKYVFEFEFWNNHDKCEQLGDHLPAALKFIAAKIAKNTGFAELFKPVAQAGK